MSKQILTKTVNANLKSVLSILILNGYYLHHSYCNLCNCPIGNFEDSKPHMGMPSASEYNLYQKMRQGLWEKAEPVPS